MKIFDTFPVNGDTNGNGDGTNGHSSGYANLDPLELYWRDVRKLPLISPAQEVELAKRIKAGDEKAFEEFVEANLRLVVKIARDYEGMGLPLLDLINEGNIGLMKGVVRFKPGSAKFSTYGSWWIKQAIKLALCKKSRTIRLSVGTFAKLSKMRRAIGSFWDEYGREPTEDELAIEMDMPIARLRHLRQNTVSTVCIDAPINPGGGTGTFVELTVDDSTFSPSEVLDDKVRLEMLYQSLEVLTPRERRVLTLRFGLDGNGERMLEEVGQEFGKTRERIRQIQNKALKKLRRNKKLRMINA